ncbi:MAG: GNAT family N-acetyltransferase [Clostridia bacterium]|nr:GNAT family N-acetyltransferase [Clostridia bacterium]
MNFYWTDYNPTEMKFVEKWLDKTAVKFTGMDDGWEDFYKYWKNEKDTILNQNYWCKVVSEKGLPFCVIALGFHEDSFVIMEMLVSPKMRNKGKGTLIIKELIENSKQILGKEIQKAEAVIYPSNKASQRCFEKAGFVLERIHEDGDAIDYVFYK